MAPIYSLRDEDDEVHTFADLQVTGAVLTTKLGAADVLELAQKTDAIPDALAAVLPNKAYVTLLENGSPVYAGRVQPSTRMARPGLRRPYRIVGGWSELTGRYYAQPWAAGTGDGADFSRVNLAVDPATGALIKTGAQIRAVMQWAIDHGAKLALGQVDDGILVVPEYQDSRSCGEVIARMLQHTPTMVPFIDYTTTPVPTFHCAEAAVKYTGAGLRGIGVLTGATAFGGLKTVTVPKELFAGTLEVHRSFENEINGIIMTVKTQTLQPEADVAPGADQKFLTSWLSVKVPDDAHLGDEGVVPFTFDGKDFEAFAGLDIEDLLTTQARTLLLAVSQLGWTGSGSLKGQLAPLAPGVGYRVNVGGAETEWEMMNAIVRSSRRDLLAGTNTVAWGPSPSLTLEQLVSQALSTRKRSPVTKSLIDEQKTGQSGDQNYGFDSKDGDKKGKDKDLVTLQMRAVQVAGAGTDRATVQFKGKVVS